ncbi:esterase/lipase family protein [Rhizobium ruizarguesonis]
MEPAVESHLVILVHGIRDIGRWQNEISATLKQHGFLVELTNFDRMNLLEFLFPIDFFRRNAQEIVWTQIQEAIQLHPGAKVSIIAHSFGTYVVANILKKQFTLSLNRVIFCGSVVRYNFPFEQINKRFNSPILNEVGTADPWPALAESVTTGYGSAGTYGFRRPGVIDRFHNDKRHGDFLSEAFCETFWVPFLRNGEIVPGSKRAKHPPVWVQLISIFKAKYLIAAFLLLVVLWIGARTLWGPENYSYELNGKFSFWNAPVSQMLRDVNRPCWLPAILCKMPVLTTLIAGREFKPLGTIEGGVKDIVSCRPFRYPTSAGETTTNPTEALRALGRQFPECVETEETKNQISVVMRSENMTPVLRQGRDTAYLCGCDSNAVHDFEQLLK